MDIVTLQKDLRLLQKIFLFVFFSLYILGQIMRISPKGSDQAIIAEYSGIKTYLTITENNTLIGWGANNTGLIGNGTLNFYPYFARKTILTNIVSVFSNKNTCAMAIDKDGTLWGWGKHRTLLLMEGNSKQDKPIKIMDHVIDVGIGLFHVVALKEDGTLWSWGQNYAGQLGTGSRGGQTYKPVHIMDNITSVYAFYDISFAIDKNHNLFVWGNQLSSKESSPMYTPFLVTNGVKSVHYYGLRKYIIETTYGETLILDISSTQHTGTYESAKLLSEPSVKIPREQVPAISVLSDITRKLFFIEILIFEILISLLKLYKKKCGI